MRLSILVLTLIINSPLFAAPRFINQAPLESHYEIDSSALCATAKQTLAYLNKGSDYDPQVIHPGKVLPIPLWRIKATLAFICKHQNQLNDPQFIKKNFEFIRWLPDVEQAKKFSRNKPLVANLPDDRILMTKYYVHLAPASSKATSATPFALYGLPKDEQALSLEEANAIPTLTRFRYGKQAILAGALSNKQVPTLAFLRREDLEAALMQGTLIADFDKGQKKIFNVHRNNNKDYDRLKKPELQERYWYFKEVAGIKGYGKDAEYKITVDCGVTFAANLTEFGLGKLLLVQYPDQKRGQVSRIGILADTGGAFDHNLYQVDFLAGAYSGKEAYSRATRHLPDYVKAYFMVLKKH